MKTFKITDEKDITSLTNYLHAQQVLTDTKVLSVEIKEFKDTISSKQRKLYWVWIGKLANHLGYLAKELHETMKEELLLPIYHRDNVDNFNEVANNINGMKGTPQHVFFREREIKKMSITKLEVPQMAEYMSVFQIYSATTLDFTLETLEEERMLLNYEQ